MARVIKRVYSYNSTTGAYEATYISAKEASLMTGLPLTSIRMCCLGKYRTSGPHMWSYVKMSCMPVGAPKPPGRAPRPVYSYSLYGFFEKKYASVTEASRALSISPGGIIACCKGLLRSSGGHVWTYKDVGALNPKPDNRRLRRIRPVYGYSKVTGLLCKRFGSTSEASEATGLSVSGINKSCNRRTRSCGSYIWSYAYALSYDEIEEDRLEIERLENQDDNDDLL